MSATPLASRRRTIALVVVAAAFVMDILDLTIVNVALPTLQADLGAGGGSIQWIVAGYATVFAVLLAVGGRLGDIYGYRRLLAIGIAGFTLASLACGLAGSATALIAARLVQAAAAAMMLPQVMSLVQRMFAPHERVGALGVFGVLGGTAAVLGPVIGGVLIGANLFGLGWRSIFLVNVPLGAVLLPIALRLLPDGRSHHAPGLDGGGVLLGIATAFALVFPIIEGRELGWPAWCVLLLFGSVPLGALLALHSRRRIEAGRDALFVPSLLAQRGFAQGLLISLVFQAAVASLLFTLSLTMQQGLGFSPFDAAMAHVPFAIGSSIAIAQIARRLVPRFGARVMLWGEMLMIAGCTLIGTALVTLPKQDVTVALLAVPMLLLGAGMGLVSGPLAPIALAEVDIGLAGAASGLLKTVQEMGGAIGVALLGGLYLALAAPGAKPARSMTGSPVTSEPIVLAGIIMCLLVCGVLATRLRRALNDAAAKKT